ncbi:MAG TPA: tetratricopeptide repeat protein [Drouetiella sp.]|jgi:Tetratricopeptide repeat
MSEWKALRAATFSLSISLLSAAAVHAQGISEMGAVHSMSATMGAGLHSQSGAASGGLNNVYGAINKQLGGAAAGTGGSGGNSSISSAGSGSSDFPNVAVDPRLTVLTAGKESNHLYDLAVQKLKAGKNGEAEQLFIRSAAIRQSIWGNRDPAVWKIMEKIGEVKSKRGDYAGAEQWYRVVLTAELKHYGAGTYELVPILEKMGQVSLQQKKYSDAQNYLQQVYTQKLRKFGAEKPETVATALELSRAYSESGALTDSADLLNKTIEAKSTDAGSPQMVKLLEAYLAVLKKQNKAEESARIEARLNTIRPAPAATSTVDGANPAKVSELDKSKTAKVESKVGAQPGASSGGAENGSAAAASGATATKTEVKTSETKLTSSAAAASKSSEPVKEPVKIDEFK